MSPEQTRPPEISVIMTVYNDEQYVVEAMDTILGQTFKDFEFVIVDDGSTDGSPQAIASRPDPRIRIFRQENAGITKARNRAIRECRGRFVAIIDADDLAFPERLAKQAEVLRSRPGVGMVAAHYQIIGPNKELYREVRLPTEHEALSSLLLKKNPFPPSIVMFRRSVLERIGFHDETLRFSQDYDFWLRIAGRYELASVPDVLGAKRIHPGMAAMTNPREKLKCVLRIKRRTIRERGLPFRAHLACARQYLCLLLPEGLLKLLFRLREAAK